MKRKIANTILGAAGIGCLIWGAVAPGLQALIPLFLLIACGIALLDINTDWIWNA